MKKTNEQANTDVGYDLTHLRHFRRPKFKDFQIMILFSIKFATCLILQIIESITEQWH